MKFAEVQKQLPIGYLAQGKFVFIKTKGSKKSLLLLDLLRPKYSASKHNGSKVK